jgi:SAM-dependent methyltransferase
VSYLIGKRSRAKRLIAAVTALTSGSGTKSKSSGASSDLMLDADWYHSIELKPGIYTPGKKYPNIALTRKVLKGCEVKNQICLDVGAMDGLMSILLSRRGARRVVACDRYDRRPQINVVTRALRLDLDYLSCVSLADVRNTAPHLLGNPFDLIVFSGVLYHMYDPMNGIGLIRSMVRLGGIVIVEAQVVLSKRMVGYFNAYGNIENDCHNYWQLSVELLDYLLRYFRLRPLDCVHFPLSGVAAEDGSPVLRVCIPCEAVAISLPDPGDTYMAVDGRDDDADFPNWGSETVRALSYTPSVSDLVRRPSGAVNLHETIIRTAPLAYGESDIKLALGSSL